MTNQNSNFFNALAAAALVFTVNLCAQQVQTVQRVPRDNAKLIRHGKAIPNHYIVVLKDELAPEEFARKAAPGHKVSHVFTNSLRGVALEMSEAEADAVSRDARVSYVEEDAEIEVAPLIEDSPAAGSGQAHPMAATVLHTFSGIDRIDQRESRLDGRYVYWDTGRGVNVYVVDTGIRRTHQEFEGRVGGGFDAIQDGRGTDDCVGHGTLVAGVIGGKTYGVAKQVMLHPVRVFTCTGQIKGGGNLSSVVAGVNWIAANHVKPAIANLSLGYNGPSPALDDAVRNLIQKGVMCVVAPSNAGVDASNQSPARVAEALRVGGTNLYDARLDTSVNGEAVKSDFGAVLDLFAPGEYVPGPGIGSDTEIKHGTGTSFAAPMVTGAAALYLQGNPRATPAQVHATVVNNATTHRLGTVSGHPGNLGAGSPDRLLYSMIGNGNGVGGNDPCTNCTPYDFEALDQLTFPTHLTDPNSFYLSYSAGSHSGWLRAPAGSSLGIYLYQYNGTKWNVVAHSQLGSDVAISYNGGPGIYLWVIFSPERKTINGTFWSKRPN